MTKFILKSSTKKQEWLKSIVHILRYALRIFSKSSIRMPDVIIMPNVIIIMLDTVPRISIVLQIDKIHKDSSFLTRTILY